MLGSESTYFFQDKELLNHNRVLVVQVLLFNCYSFKEIGIYLDAYDYFIKNPNAYDGATLVRDLYDIPNLDLDAMLHDYFYIIFNVASNLITKWKADWLYCQEQICKGKPKKSAYARFIGLTFTSIEFLIYTKIKRGKITEQQKQKFNINYNILMT